ncbi:NAD(P)H-dependent nitrite reductase catalytic subunit [Terriglobus roseus DSM 18391]|uniref:NAD(P)H-dependent nitrite reductase catalytic subunit n=1 Tax=Terriglobus roseus (strain DSM 18391 / NRRL B-41598 / KBS 63) TaxID=926566 RepID=I3ZE56_TERRK|nr:NirA family protein [Terriglobus roseus]AFL87524.1 NAD(P)H-dependent nitrite reductase catalytic subunit [Terriglobus roseus DSM 18391]
MTDAPSDLTTGDFTDEQKQYLQGFFAGATQRMPFVGHTGAGALTNDPTRADSNLAVATADVEPTVWGTPVSDLCAEEVWKYERNPLDCWDDLLRHAAMDSVPDAEFRYRFKSFGLFHVAPAQDSFMLRMRVPGGVLTSHQMRGLAKMAEQWGCGRIDLTTRANVQLRELQPRNIVDVLNTIQKLGMSSRGSGADNLRNFTASPISGFDAQELIDVQPFADALQNYMSNSRDMFGLPRKFNIAFDNGGSISVLADTNDIGFTAVRVASGRSVPEGVYFRVLLCGITGHKQFASDCGLLLLPDQLVAVAAAMVRVFAEHGDRTDRKKARLKYLIDRWGVPKFLEEVQKKLDFPVIHCDAAECEPRGPIDRAGHLGAHAQSQDGLHYMGITIPVGWLPTEQARALADVADRFSTGELRLTVWQNLLIPNIAAADLEAAKAAVREAGLEYEAGRVLSGTVACTGSRGCRFAMTDTKAHALEIARTLDTMFPIDSPVNLHVTGCPNSCAQHYIGDIGLMGVKVNGGEGYQVNLGGSADNDQGMARELFPAMPYAEVIPALQGVFAIYQQRHEASESFLEFTRRHAVEELRSMCGQQVLSQGDAA